MACDCCKNAYCEFLWKYYTPLVRIWGMATAAAFWAIAITALQTGDLFGIYFVVVASIITLLELIFFFEPCFEKCCRPDSCCGKAWTIISWLDNWKRSAIYIALSVICYIDHQNIWAIVGGTVLDLLAILYIFNTYQQQALNHAASPRDDPPRDPSQLVPPTSSGYRRFGATSSSTDTTKKETDGLVNVNREQDVTSDRYVEGPGTNPFGDFDDDDANPDGDAGISRYP